jgi:hypothetical protein
MEYKNELEDRAGGLVTAKLHWKRSLNVSVFVLSVKDRTLLVLASRSFY